MNVKPLLYDWLGANEEFFLLINSIRIPELDRFLAAFTQLGSYKLFPYYLGVFAGCFLLSTIISAARGQRLTRYRTAQWLGVLLVLFAGFAGFALAVKSVKEHAAFPRPYVALADQEVYHVTPEKSESAYGVGYDNRSFPSGHAAFTTFLLIAFWPLLNSGFQILGIALVVLMCWSRVSLGLHFPADVLAGVLISLFIVPVVRFVLFRIMLKLFGLRC